jgi:fibronectin-binding autotransporter adhesin
MQGETVMKRFQVRKRTLVSVVSLAVAGTVVAAVAAHSSAAPVNSAAPTISGDAREGSTLTASNGTWTNNPTTYAYKWQRCQTDGSGCGDLAGGTDKTYTLTSADVSHTVRVVVTAENADGKTSKPSAPTDVVASKNGPKNTVKPSVSGKAQVGGQLTVSNGTWTPTPTSYSFIWQRCDAAGAHCVNVFGATGRSYGIRSADLGHRMRALVTAHTSTDVATAASSTSGLVQSSTTTTTVTTTKTTTTTATTTVHGNRAPSISFLSLRRVRVRVYVRFRVCDDGLGTIHVTARESKNRVLSASHRFTVTRTTACSVFSRSWKRAARFSRVGRYVVTLRAQDTSRALSRIASKSLAR